MNFDFETPVDRRGTDCVKYDALGPWFGNPDLLPYWVADMDLPSPPFVARAIQERAGHPVYGYPFRLERLTNVLCQWYLRRQNWVVAPEEVIFSPGVVPALSMAVLALTSPGDEIIVQPPVYFPFFEVVGKNERTLVLNPLIFEGGRLRMDFGDLEAKMAAGARVLILSSPHNPGGSVWTREELTILANLCQTYDVTVFSDEIHGDLVFKPHHHIPLASLNPDMAQRTLTFVAPSKTFNVSGLATAFVVISNPVHRKLFQDRVDSMHLMIGNIFGFVAAEAAYSQGDEWLDALMTFLAGHVDYVMEYFRKNLPGIIPVRPEGTFLVWLDCRGLGMTDAELGAFFREKAGLALNDGAMFGQGGSGFMRLNIGCPRQILTQGLDRLRLAVQELPRRS